MKTEDLAVLLDQATDILKQNKAMATSESLNTVHASLEKIRSIKLLQSVLSAALEIDPGQVTRFCDSIDQGLDIEKKLTQSDLTDKIINVLQGLKNHPLALRIIASML